MSRELPLDSPAFAPIELFRGVPERALHRIAETARVRRLPKRARIFSQGDGNVRAHAVIEGAVSIVQSGSDGAQVAMRIVGPGQTFGSVGLFTDRRYPADAITVMDTVEASWSEADFQRFVGSHPQIALNFIGIIGRRLQEMQNRVRELATRRAEGRIAAAVLRLADQTGRPTAAGIAIGVPLRRKDVAEFAGTTLHTASRVLAAWEKEGVIANGKRILTLVRTADLRSLAED